MTDWLDLKDETLPSTDSGHVWRNLAKAKC